MANTKYAGAGEGFLDGSIVWSTDTMKLCLVGAGYTPDAVADRVLDDVPGGEIIATSGALTGKTEADSVADADNVTVSSVSGADIHYVVIFQDTGSSATSRLVALIDDAGGLPLTPNGGDIAVDWDSGPNKIFKL